MSSSQTLSQFLNPWMIISSAINNPLTFLLLHLSKPSQLIAIFNSPIPLSLSPPNLNRRFLIAGAAALLLLFLAAGTLVLGSIILFSPLIIVFSPVWVPLAVAGAGVSSVAVLAAATIAWVVQRFFRVHKVKPPCSDLKKEAA